MSREKELVKNTVILSLGKFLPRLLSLVTLPIVTAQLTKAEYGTYDLAATLVMLLMPIATLQIQSAAFRFLIDYRGDKDNSSRIITNIFIVTIPISLLVSIGLILYMGNLPMVVRIAISGYFFADSIYNTVAQIARGLSYNKIYSIGAILMSVVNCLGVIFSVQFAKQGLFGVMLSLALANAAASIYIIWKSGICSYIKFNKLSKTTIKEMILYSWPMIPNNLSNWVLKLSDRLVITAVCGLEANAIYAVANKIPNLLSTAQSVFVMAWHENASIAVQDQDAEEYYSKMCDSIFCLLLGFTALLICCTPLMFVILIRGDYDEAYAQIPILILGMFFYCFASFQGGIYIAHKKTANVGITTTIAAGLNLLIDILLVKSLGITAGSISTLISYFVLYLYRAIDVKRFQKIKYNYKKQCFMIILIIFMLIICVMREFWLNIINIIFAVIFFVVFNKTFIKNLKNKLLKKFNN